MLSMYNISYKLINVYIFYNVGIIKKIYRYMKLYINYINYINTYYFVVVNK